MSNSVSSVLENAPVLDESEYEAMFKLCLLVLCSDGAVFGGENEFIDSFLKAIPDRGTASHLIGNIMTLKVETINILASRSEELDSYIGAQCTGLSDTSASLVVDIVSKAVMADNYASSAELHLAEKIISSINLSL
ncbi:MAG: hypothetical protein KTR16_09110 [Acidiferrobacterales bacterium]|nr:hypothetical protein [Acidiferrobacterales bacterium]